jgi:hypothetical protein
MRTTARYIGGVVLIGVSVWLLAAGSMGVAAQATPGSPALSVVWSVNLGEAVPSGFSRFAACADGSVVTYERPGRLFKVSARGQPVAARGDAAYDDVLSIDCGEDGVVRAYQVLQGRRMRLLEFAQADLRPIRGRDVEPNGSWPGAVKYLDGAARVVLAGPDGALLARLDGTTVVERFGERLAPPAGVLRLDVVPAFTPLFFRADRQRLVYLQTSDYAILEFDRVGTRRGVRRRRDARPGVTLRLALGGALPTSAEVVGAAMLPDDRLAVHLNASGVSGPESYLEVLDSRYDVAARLPVPRKGMLFGADADAALYFSDVSSEGVVVWKGAMVR